MITGDSGVGKTRLVHELKHYCSFRDALFSVGGTGIPETGGPGRPRQTQ